MQFNYEIKRISFKNEPIDLVQSVYVIPNNTNPFSKVIVSMLDITKLKEYEREIIQHRNHLEELVEKRTEKIIELNKNLTTVNKQINEQKEELQSTVTKLKETQSQLIESEKMASLGMLTAGVAHEINNPINFISSGNQALEMIANDIWDKLNLINILVENNDNSDIKNKLKTILTEINDENYNVIVTDILNNIQMGVNRVVKIVESLQSYSRKSENTETLVDIEQTFEESLTILNNKFKNRINIIKEFNNTPPFLCALNKLEQVLINLLSNSFDAISNEGTVHISTKINSKKTVEISIKDDGCGIKKEDLNKIFDPFFTTKDPNKGTGLGMYITYGIINQLNGNISIDSTINKGTTVTIKLPFKT
jgi:signal transduction histidine kinase